MALNPIDGKLWAAERFAIDYVQLGADGTLFTGDQAKVESYPYFGADIHAVADGPVVGVVDGMPEQVPGKSPTGLALDEYAGNHIVQDLGDGNYALYAHIKTGSGQGEARRPTDHRTGDRLGGQHRQLRCAAPALPCDEHAGPAAFRRSAVRRSLVHARLPARQRWTRSARCWTEQPAPLQPGVAKREENDVSPHGSRRHDL